MKSFIFSLGIILLIAIAGCTDSKNPTGGTTVPVTAVPAVSGSDITLSSQGLTYPAYIAAPGSTAKYPGIILLHSFNGLEPGYRTMVDRFAAQGYVVIAPQWQNFNKSPSDEDVASLTASAVAFMKARNDVDSQKLGLTGFCAGGRYTMLFLPQMKEFRSGVAWYGFPYNPGFANETRPVDHLNSLSAPILMIHGSGDMASPVTDIYKYAGALNQSQKYFELKVYQGQPHGFMIVNGKLNESDIANDAFREMVSFFDRSLEGPGISGS